MSLVTNSARAERITPRMPARADSRVRYDKLVKAVGKLLATYGPSEITVQMIADAARMPTATVYHFFPSAEAALVAQARLYVASFEASMQKQVPMSARTPWPKAWRINSQTGRNLYVNDLARMRLLLGADLPRDVQVVDAEFNVRLGRLIVAQFERETFLPRIAKLEEACTNAVEINDMFWRKSFQQTGTISDAYFNEGIRAVVAYLETYLPADLKYRNP